MQLCQDPPEGLFQAMYLIQRTLDFDQSDIEGRFVVKPGLDEALDGSKNKTVFFLYLYFYFVY